jgi:hypothetical protein
MKIYLFLVLLLCPLLLLAQGEKKLVQVTGLVVSGSQANGVPGVAITIPKAGRGVITNQLGYFSMPAMPGDSAIISALGFRKQYYKIPNDGRTSISIIIRLEDDPIFLPEVEIFPYPTEELFKQAFLNLQLPEEDINRMRRNLDEDVLAKMRFDMPMDGSMNHTFFIQQQVLHIENRNSMAALQLTNPFAWARVINAFRRGDYDKDKKKKK